MGKTKTLTEKQKQRAELNEVLDYNERRLVAMQKQGWKDLSDDQINILENVLALAIATMRICPPAYVGVASNTVRVRAKTVEAVNLVKKANGKVIKDGGSPRQAVVSNIEEDGTLGEEYKVGPGVPEDVKS